MAATDVVVIKQKKEKKMSNLDKDAARELIQTRAQFYFQKEQEKQVAHNYLKAAIRKAKQESRLTQQEIADATLLVTNGKIDGLSRQRIGQILHGE